MKNILVVGSMNMDYTIYCDEFPKDGETIIGTSRFIQPGGKGANQAAAIGKSGLANVRFVSACGNDNDGKTIVKTLEKLNIDCQIKESEYQTGNATIVVNKASENKIIIIGGANNDVLPDEKMEESIRWADYIVLQNEIPAKTNAFVMKMGHELGKVVIYNPAPYRPIDNEILKYVDFFTPNKIESSLYSGNEDLDETIHILHKEGVKNVLITLGTKGSICSDGKNIIHVDCVKVKAVDTVAAGDTFAGYFVSALSTGRSVEESMKIASKASSITVSRKGSVISIPFGKEVL